MRVKSGAKILIGVGIGIAFIEASDPKIYKYIQYKYTKRLDRDRLKLLIHHFSYFIYYFRWLESF